MQTVRNLTDRVIKPEVSVAGQWPACRQKVGEAIELVGKQTHDEGTEHREGRCSFAWAWHRDRLPGRDVALHSDHLTT